MVGGRKILKFEVELDKVPKFGNMEITFWATSKKGQDKMHELPEIFGGDTQVSQFRFLDEKKRY